MYFERITYLSYHLHRRITTRTTATTTLTSTANTIEKENERKKKVIYTDENWREKKYAPYTILICFGIYDADVCECNIIESKKHVALFTQPLGSHIIFYCR